MMAHGGKKKFVELSQVVKFITTQPPPVVAEYREIVNELETRGRLEMPLGEKVSGTLFAIRVVQSGNVRVFYVYGSNDMIYGIHAYEKKTRTIPVKEKDRAVKVSKLLRQEGLTK